MDLDETLVHASETKLDFSEADFRFDKYWVYKRPYLEEFLLSIKNDFKVAIWSLAGDEYVTKIVKNIIPEKYNLEFVWARSKCTLKRDYDLDAYFYSKPLKKLKTKGYLLEKILILDDSPEKGRDNYGNSIYIKEFIGDKDDELKKLLIYLRQLKDADNVRVIEKRGWERRSYQ